MGRMNNLSMSFPYRITSQARAQRQGPQLNPAPQTARAYSRSLSPGTSSALVERGIVDLERGDAPLETPDLPTNKCPHQSRRSAPRRSAACALPASAGGRTHRLPVFVSHLQKSAHVKSWCFFCCLYQRARGTPWHGLVGSSRRPALMPFCAAPTSEE